MSVRSRVRQVYAQFVFLRDKARNMSAQLVMQDDEVGGSLSQSLSQEDRCRVIVIRTTKGQTNEVLIHEH